MRPIKSFPEFMLEATETKFKAGYYIASSKKFGDKDEVYFEGDEFPKTPYDEDSDAYDEVKPAEFLKIVKNDIKDSSGKPALVIAYFSPKSSKDLNFLNQVNEIITIKL